MKIHADGTLEGSPEELAAYKRGQELTAILESITKNLLVYGSPTKPDKESIWGKTNTSDLIPHKGPGNSIEQQNKYGHMTYKKEGPAPLVMFAPSHQVDWRKFSSVQRGKIMTEADWTIDQIRQRYPLDSDSTRD